MPAFSKLSCYEVAHPWTPSCITHITGMVKSSYWASLKIYTAVYLLSSIFRKNKKKYLKKQFFKDVLRSANFLAMNTWLVSVIGCFTRKHLFHYEYMTFAFVPGFFSSLIAISTEDTYRRRVLAVYMASVALESLYRSLMAHKILPAVPNADIILFCFASSLLVWLLKKSPACKSDVVEAAKFIIGTHEVSVTNVRASSEQALELNRRNRGYLQSLIFKTKCCSHAEKVCVLYALKGSCKLAMLGGLLQLALNLLLLARSRNFSVRNIVRQLSANAFSLSAFLGSYVFLIRSVCCLLRHATQSDHVWHGLVSGFLAGFALKFYRSIEIPLYLLSRISDVLYEIGAQAGLLPRLRFGSEILYTLSTAIVLHFGAFEPQNVKPSYFKSVILAVSGGRAADLNRRVFTDVSPLSDVYRPNYWPQFDPRYVPEYMLTDDALKVIGLKK